VGTDARSHLVVPVVSCLHVRKKGVVNELCFTSVVYVKAREACNSYYVININLCIEESFYILL
jgi:hypothetical protein